MAEFRRRSKDGLSDEDSKIALSLIFGSSFSFPVRQLNYGTGTTFFRARAIPRGGLNPVLDVISKVGDAWEPPPNVVRVQGRLNAINQSVLYCCPLDINLAIDEARARQNDLVAIMVYVSKRPINVALLGNFECLQISQDHGSELLYYFLNEEFSRNVLPGEEGRYSITRMIAESYFNYPGQDAWCYRSVQSPDRCNVAFLPNKSQFCLQLRGVMICEPRVLIGGNPNVKSVIDFDENSGIARYHRMGSREQMEIFPEIGPRRGR